MLTALGGVAAGVVIFLIVLALAGPRSTKQSESAQFKVGSAKHYATEVDKNGPLLFQDLLNKSKDIYLQHLSGNDWRAFDAHAPGQPRRCVLAWQKADRTFKDPCGGAVYPADGTGLPMYPAKVDEKGLLSVDLRAP